MVVSIGAEVQAIAMRWAACPPVNAWRWRCCFLSCKTASNPPERYDCRTRMEVLRVMLNASQICSSVHPSAALSKACARVKVRALALPAWMKVWREARSVSDKVTGMGCCMESFLWFSFSIPSLSISAWTDH